MDPLSCECVQTQPDGLSLSADLPEASGAKSLPCQAESLLHGWALGLRLRVRPRARPRASISEAGAESGSGAGLEAEAEASVTATTHAEPPEATP